MLTSFCDSFAQVLGVGREAFKNSNLWDKVFTGWLVISCLFWRKIPGTPYSCPPSYWGLFQCPVPLLLTGLRLRARKCVCVPPNTGHSVLYYFQPVGPGNLYLLFFISTPWTLETLDSKNNPCHSVVQNASVHVFSWNCFSPPHTRSPTASFTPLHAQDTVCSVSAEVARPAWEVGVKQSGARSGRNAGHSRLDSPRPPRSPLRAGSSLNCHMCHRLPPLCADPTTWPFRTENRDTMLTVLSRIWVVSLSLSAAI